MFPIPYERTEMSNPSYAITLFIPTTMFLDAKLHYVYDVGQDAGLTCRATGNKYELIEYTETGALYGRNPEQPTKGN